ncbi:hypothetical protein [Rufibacter hautae]|uniref:STAS/SEC14 domain-containing protein n=1 Tax=Rufibacter hautae TaxID=2595005 RepID=A0A5B6THX4_9BACT|nr:hypothetical protein [Rufibacter hautae]KAA3440274.1 hypothetical protein FOA19_06355 [Rufibacter hautae]
MILFENSIVRLNYDPGTDILEVAYPDLHGYLLPEIKHTINKMVDIIKNYDVKKLLLDSTQTIISVGEEESREISMYLAAGLSRTRLQKVARLQSSSEGVEKVSERNIEQIKAAQQLPFALRNFRAKAEALDWLKADQSSSAPA